MKMVLVIHNVRSCHNVGSLFRSADGLGFAKVVLTGYTPYPLQKNDRRLPHISARIGRQIHKTALGAEKTLDWCYESSIIKALAKLKSENYLIAGLEQSALSIPLTSFDSNLPIALVVGNEVGGVEKEVLDSCDVVLEIPMKGHKESLNVSVAGAIAMYHLAQTGHKLDK